MEEIPHSDVRIKMIRGHMSSKLLEDTDTKIFVSDKSECFVVVTEINHNDKTFCYIEDMCIFPPSSLRKEDRYELIEEIMEKCYEFLIQKYDEVRKIIEWDLKKLGHDALLWHWKLGFRLVTMPSRDSKQNKCCCIFP